MDSVITALHSILHAALLNFKNAIVVVHKSYSTTMDKKSKFEVRIQATEALYGMKWLLGEATTILLALDKVALMDYHHLAALASSLFGGLVCSLFPSSSSSTALFYPYHFCCPNWDER